jgi:hypothetical protein
MTPDMHPHNAMQKWLLYGLVAKGIAIIVIVLTVLWYAGILG